MRLADERAGLAVVEGQPRAGHRDQDLAVTVAQRGARIDAPALLAAGGRDALADPGLAEAAVVRARRAVVAVLAREQRGCGAGVDRLIRFGQILIEQRIVDATGHDREQQQGSHARTMCSDRAALVGSSELASGGPEGGAPAHRHL